MTHDRTAPDAARLYPGTVMHARLSDAHHRFSYKVVSLTIDLDRLEEASRQSPLFAVDRRAPVSFHQRDHGPKDGSSLRAHADRLLQEAGLAQRAACITLLCYPRIFGYAFNPLSVYYAYDGDGELTALIYEVRNTFGDMHSYVMPIAETHRSPAGIRQSCDKAFYVSPFMSMRQRYHFRISAPDEHVRIRILETDDNGPTLSATFSGSALPLTSVNLLGTIVGRPWRAAKVICGIHWEALKLWLKGARFHGRKAPWFGYSVVKGPAADTAVRLPSRKSPAIIPLPLSVRSDMRSR